MIEIEIYKPTDYTGMGSKYDITELYLYPNDHNIKSMWDGVPIYSLRPTDMLEYRKLNHSILGQSSPYDADSHRILHSVGSNSSTSKDTYTGVSIATIFSYEGNICDANIRCQSSGKSIIGLESSSAYNTSSWSANFTCRLTMHKYL